MGWSMASIFHSNGSAVNARHTLGAMTTSGTPLEQMLGIMRTMFACSHYCDCRLLLLSSLGSPRRDLLKKEGRLRRCQIGRRCWRHVGACVRRRICAERGEQSPPTPSAASCLQPTLHSLVSIATLPQPPVHSLLFTAPSP